MRWMRWTTKVPVLAIIGVCLLLFPSLILHNPYLAILAGVGILFIIIDGIYFLGMRSNKFEESKLNMIVSFAIFPLLLIFLILGLSFIIYVLTRTKYSKIEKTKCEFFNTEISYNFICDVKEKLEILGVDETNKTFDLKYTSTISCDENAITEITYYELDNNNTIKVFKVDDLDVTPTNVETLDRRLYGYSKKYTYEITISKSSTVYIEFQDTVKYDELGKYKVISFRCQDKNVEIPSGYELVSGRPASRYVYLTNEGIPDKYTNKGEVDAIEKMLRSR